MGGEDGCPQGGRGGKGEIVVGYEIDVGACGGGGFWKATTDQATGSRMECCSEFVGQGGHGGRERSGQTKVRLKCRYPSPYDSAMTAA